MATIHQRPKKSERLPDDLILIELDADFGDDGQFGKQTLQVTPDWVRIIDDAGTRAFQMPIAEIKSARNEPLVGGGRLEITAKSGECIPIITYSQSHAHKFSEAARGIEQLAKDEPLSINVKEERTRCPKCNRLLPEKDGVCPACVNRGRVLLRIAGFLTPYKWHAIGLAVLAVLTTALNLLPPMIQRWLIDGVLDTHRNLPRLYWLMAGWLGVLLGSVVVQIVTARLTAFLAGNIAADLRGRLYRAIEFLRLGYFDKKQVGAITSRVTQDTDRVWGFLVNGLPYFVINGLLMLGITAFLLNINTKLTLCIISPVPIVVVIGVVFWKPMSTMFHRVGQKWARFHMHLNESLSGIRVVKAFAQEDHENTKFMQRNNELRDAGMRSDIAWFTIFGCMTSSRAWVR